jgi:hypothetical protein
MPIFLWFLHFQIIKYLLSLQPNIIQLIKFTHLFSQHPNHDPQQQIFPKPQNSLFLLNILNKFYTFLSNLLYFMIKFLTKTNNFLCCTFFNNWYHIF